MKKRTTRERKRKNQRNKVQKDLPLRVAINHLKRVFSNKKVEVRKTKATVSRG